MKIGKTVLRTAALSEVLSLIGICYALAVSSRAEPASEKADKAGAASEEKRKDTLPSDPDKAWKEIDAASKAPPLPAEWAGKTPTDEQKAAFYKLLGERSADVAAKAREFYTRFPDHPKAVEAKERETRFQHQAAAYGNTTAKNDAKESSTDEDKLHQKMNDVQRRAMEKRSEGMPAVLKEFESGMRALAKEYPDRAEPWDALLVVAQRGEKEDAKRVLTDIIAAKGADEETKGRAKGMLKVIGAIGQPLEIRFTAVDGQKIDIQKMKGKVVLVDFWASWCGPCMAGLPEVIDIYQRYHDKGLEIVGINLDKDKRALERTIEAHNMTWAQYFAFQHIGILSLEFHVDKLSRPLL